MNKNNLLKIVSIFIAVLVVGGVFGAEFGITIGDAEKFGDDITKLDDANLKSRYWSELIIQGKDKDFQKKVFDKLDSKSRFDIFQKRSDDNKRDEFMEFMDNEQKADIIEKEVEYNNNGLKVEVLLSEGDYTSVKVKNHLMIITDKNGVEHEMPTEDITGFKEIGFSKMKKGGEGYAVYYNLKKGEWSAGFLSSGILKDNGDGWDIIEKGKKVGELKFGDNPKNAVYFRGVPKDVKESSFSLGDYVWNEKGRGEDISFKNAEGISISSDERDITTEDGRYGGYQNKKGMRGAVEIDGVSIRSIHKNNIGVKFGDKIIGSESQDVIEIKKKDEGDIEVSFPSGAKNIEILSSKGNVFVKGVQVSEKAGKPVKFINGKVENEINVGRISGSAEGERVKSGNDAGKGSIMQGVEGLQISSGDDSKNKIKNPMDAEIHKYINHYRGSDLQWDDRIAKESLQHSITMAKRGWIGHDGFGRRIGRLGGGGAENVAMFGSYQSLSAKEVGRRFSKMWINSPGHRTNIMGGYSRAGVGVYMIEKRKGYYEYYATQIFQ